jgi:SAM-dependent methyltransferase
MPPSALLDRLRELHEGGRDLKILDLGGWAMPCRQATHIVDIMPFETLRTGLAYGFGEMRLQPDHYHQIDLGKGEPLPFPDKFFDFAICRHTLEDIANPVFVCRELSRVSRAGYVETPHRVYESTKGVERHQWAGHYHHRWLVEMEGGKIVFQMKPHNLHSRPAFHFWCPPWKKVREEFENTWLLWEGSIPAEERVIIDSREVKRNLADFKRRYRAARRLRWRWQAE